MKSKVIIMDDERQILLLQRRFWIEEARERTGNTRPVKIVHGLSEVFAGDLRRYAGNPHDLDMHLRWLWESAKTLGVVFDFSPEQILAGNSLYEREQLKRALQSEVSSERHYRHSLCGFHPDTVAYEHALYFQQEQDEAQEDCYYE